MSLVPKNYKMNPETEVLAPNGGDLENGMIVLVADETFRCNLDDKNDRTMAHVFNRWCSISQVEADSNSVTFLATYADGFETKRRVMKNVPWLIKTDGSGVKPKTPSDRSVKPEPVLPSYYETCVPKFYQMDPKTEDLLPNGRHLSNGMKVLGGDADSRAKISPEQLRHDWQINRALENNQWCTVTHLEVSSKSVRFVGVYEDGVKRIRAVSIDDAWLVKLDSVEACLEQASKRYNDVLGVVKSALQRNEELVSRHDYPASELEALPETTTWKILGLF